MKSIVIGCDNAGVALKEILADELRKRDISVEDVGCSDETDETYYPLIAEKVCRKVQDSNGMKEGILVCGTGIGMAMAANKFKGIRAAVCHDIYSAERSKLSNDANVLCMGARVIGAELAKKILAEFISLSFQDGSSTPKVAAIREIELANMK